MPGITSENLWTSTTAFEGPGALTVDTASGAIWYHHKTVSAVRVRCARGGP